jgi:hypothetical protein
MTRTALERIRARHDRLKVEPVREPRLMAFPYFDLRGDKAAAVRATPLCTDMALFVNVRCSLAHVVWADDVGDPEYADGPVPHVRQPIPRGMWGTHPESIRRWVLKKLAQKGMLR